MFRKISILLACLVFLTSCSSQNALFSDSMDLLQAPMLNEEQQALYLALESTLDMSKIAYQYPQNGEYKTPFAFYDIDGDSASEAIFFYANMDSPLEIRVKILRQDSSGNWYSFRDLAGQGDQIDFVDFAPFIDPNRSCLVIGWKNNQVTKENYIGIYSMHGEEFSTNILEEYTNFQIIDSDQDKLMELIISRDNQNDFPEIAFYKSENGRLIEKDSISLNPSTSSVLQILTGTLWDGSRAIYVDEMIQEQSNIGTDRISYFYGTEIITVSDGYLGLVAGYNLSEDSPNKDLYSSTFRWDPVLSTHIESDSTIYVPQMSNLPGTIDSDSKKRVKLTEYKQLTSSGLVTKYNAAVNYDDKYMLLLPECWLGNIMVVRESEQREWRICKINEATGRASTELFRVKLHQIGDYIDPSTNNSILLAKRDPFEYFGTVADLAGEPLAITETEAKNIFVLLES